MVWESLLLNRRWPEPTSRGNSHHRSSSRIKRRKERYAVLSIFVFRCVALKGSDPLEQKLMLGPPLGCLAREAGRLG